MIFLGGRRRRSTSGWQDQLGIVLGRGLGVGTVCGILEGKRLVVLCLVLAQPRMLTYKMSTSMLACTVIPCLETLPGWREGLGSLLVVTVALDAFSPFRSLPRQHSLGERMVHAMWCSHQ
jgi:hypothetical protein